jgi:hypothetical protein
MLHTRKNQIVSGLSARLLFALALACLVMGASVSWAQSYKSSARSTVARSNPAEQSKGEDEPLFSEYRGVRIGMTAEEARQKMGEPQDKSDEQDFFVFNEKESAQVFYDKAHKTYAISINYLGTGGGTPAPKAVLGSEIEAQPDGSMYKMVRYRKSGFWVAYSRTAGSDPLITVTMNKID